MFGSVVFKEDTVVDILLESDRRISVVAEMCMWGTCSW